MSDNQQFCLRWNNHQSTLVQVIDSLLSSDRLVDCTLAADGQYLHAHKVVLCACSPYFESLLSQHYEKHPIVILKDVRFEELKATMEYMYKGEVNINQDALGQFLKVAETLQIKGLTDGNIGDDKPSQKRHEAPQVRKPVTHQSRSSVTLPPNSSGLTIEPSKRPLPSHLSDAQPDSPIRSREGSSSPTSRKRRRRRPSQGDEDGHQENSCDLPMQGQTMSITSVPSSIPTLPSGSSSTITKAPPPDDDSENPENDRLSGVTSEGFIKEKIEPQPELLLEPKTEYMEETNNDDSVEDLTLDDDDEYEGMMDSGPGPSHGGNNPNENYAAWQQITGDRQDDSYLNPADGGHRDSQENRTTTVDSSFERFYDKTIAAFAAFSKTTSTIVDYVEPNVSSAADVEIADNIPTVTNCARTNIVDLVDGDGEDETNIVNLVDDDDEDETNIVNLVDDGEDEPFSLALDPSSDVRDTEENRDDEIRCRINVTADDTADCSNTNVDDEIEVVSSLNSLECSTTDDESIPLSKLNAVQILDRKSNEKRPRWSPEKENDRSYRQLVAETVSAAAADGGAAGNSIQKRSPLATSPMNTLSSGSRSSDLDEELRKRFNIKPISIQLSKDPYYDRQKEQEKLNFLYYFRVVERDKLKMKVVKEKQIPRNKGRRRKNKLTLSASRNFRRRSSVTMMQQARRIRSKANKNLYFGSR